MSDETSDFQGWSVLEASRRVPNLQDHLANGRLLAWGNLGNPSQFAPIPPSSWNGKMIKLSASTSRKPQAVPGGESLFNVRVFPVLLAPNVVEHLGYFSLKDAFSRFVIGDPEVQYLGNIASVKVPQFLDLYREGIGHCGYYWPLTAKNLFSIGEPDPVAEKYFGYCSTVETDLAQRALRNRYEAMLNLLRSRRLIAEGDPARPNAPQQILSTIWDSPTFHFDSRTGDILEDRDWGDEEAETFRFDDGRQNYVVRWRAVLLRPPAERVDQVREDKAELTTSERRKMTPTEKFECCFEFLRMEMELSPNFRPKTKKLFWLDARDHCRTKVSWPMFKNAWAKAKGAVPAAAPAWERAGRTRKSGQK